MRLSPHNFVFSLWASTPTYLITGLQLGCLSDSFRHYPILSGLSVYYAEFRKQHVATYAQHPSTYIDSHRCC